MNTRITKWLMFVCATMMLAACSADTSIVGPDASPVVTAPRVQGITVEPAAAEGTTRSEAAKQSSGQRGKGRYAMAAS